MAEAATLFPSLCRSREITCRSPNDAMDYPSLGDECLQFIYSSPRNYECTKILLVTIISLSLKLAFQMNEGAHSNYSILDRYPEIRSDILMLFSYRLKESVAQNLSL